MKKLTIEEWGGVEFFIEPEDVEKAESDGEVLECIRDYKGNRIYGLLRCQALAKTVDGKAIAKQIRGLCEGEGDKRKVSKKVLKTGKAKNR